MISLITSLYRPGKYLQTYLNNLNAFAKNTSIDLEVIVIGNDLQESELAELQKQQKYAPWLKVVDVPRETLYASWNRGVEMAQGEILGFWNVDDVRYFSALPDTVELFKKGAELVYFPFFIKRYISIFGKSFLVWKSKIDKAIPEYNNITKLEFMRSMFCGPFFMFTKSLFGKVGPFDEQFKIAGDFDWCVRVAKLEAKMVKAKSLAGEFRVDGGGLSAGANKVVVAETNVVHRRFGVLDKLRPEDTELAAKYQINSRLYQGQSIKI
ncbi:MAG: glycosyltransferase [Candidatus Doudnabacteria bacterium]|jgi:GT2 family glycosyltransferase